MAQFDIELDALADGSKWPDCCARCGESGGTQLVPVPPKFAKRTDGLSVPLCAKHADDWAAVRRRSRIGAALLLPLIPAMMALTWTIHPHIARPHEQNEASRWSSTIAFGFLAVLPFGGLLAWWAKTPIRVIGSQGRFATMAGVCRSFARVMMKPPPAPEPIVSDAARFDVHPDRPEPVLPLARAGNALAILFVLAGVLGAAIGLGSREIEAETAGWNPIDWHYVALGCGIALAYTMPLAGMRLVFSRAGLFLAGVVTVLVLAVFLVGRFANSMQMSFSFVYTIGPLVLQQFLAQRLIWRWKLRSTVIAVAAGAGSAAAFTAFVLMLGGLDAWPHRAVFVLGPLFALGSAGLSRSAATSPFCSACDGWLDGRRIGALPRSIQQVQPLIESGQVLALADVAPYSETAVIGDVELKLYHCPECRAAGTVVLELFDCVKSGKDGKQPLLRRVGRWEHPGAALPAIEAVFPPPPEPAPRGVHPV